MLPSSVRRVVSTTTPSAGGLASTLVSSGSKAAAATSTPFIGRGHQRRCSSSKPSRSDNESSDMPADQSVAAPARGHGKAGGEKRKRKADRDATKKLPSVPNTHHMVGSALGLSSFFSLHRPLSITQTMPKTVSDEQFAAIFAPKSKTNKINSTMSTLTSTIDQLEGPMASMTIDGQQEGQEDMQRLEIRNPDGSDASIYLQVDHMSGEFLPFRPPPLPQPQSALEAESANAEAAEGVGADEAAQQNYRSYKAMFTIEETTEADGQVRILAHSPHIVQDEQPRGFMARFAQRQMKVGGTRAGREMYAISTKRQRKLKMKKKKYKKLMKRTRNLRRKLDRT